MARAKNQRQTPDDQLLASAFDRIKGGEAATEAAELEQGNDGGEPPVRARGGNKRNKRGKLPEAPALVSSNDPERVGSSKRSAMIAYHPGPDDKSWTIWNGIKFDANIPKEVHNQDVIALARKNPWFSVDGKRAPAQRKPLPPDHDMSYDGRVGSAQLPSGADPEKAEVEAQ